MKITGNTRTLGIFGDPVEHTLSPAIHNAAFEALGLDLVYLPFRVSPEALKGAVESVRALEMPGVSVTIPHKEKVIEYLDEVDDLSKAIGAVNTIVNKGGRLKGYNTDALGYLLSLKEETGFVPKGKTIIVIGAGGAARAIAYSFIKGEAKSVIIANRTLPRAKILADEFNGCASAVTLDGVGGFMKGADIIINTTSLGMMGEGELNIPVEALPAHAVVSDIVYRPLDTQLIKKARLLGLKAHTGLGMLVQQGIIAFELWTGLKAPAEVMQKAALAALGIK